MRRPSSGHAIRAAILLALGVWLILVGQAGRDLLPPDDLREAEVAREMLVSGDFVIPHLAGLPFVEKPPGFPALLAAAYRLAGRPTVPVAHMVSMVFALAGLSVVFLLGQRVGGDEAGGLAAFLMAVSVRFVKAAHEVHLDMALTATSALALMLAWRALETKDVRAKRCFYAGTAFALGLAFLVKGLVGPALFGAGFLVYVAASGRKEEIRYALRPLPIACFMTPILIWIVPFLRDASPHVIKDFFIRNQIGRLLWGYGAHAHPFYYHLAGVFWDFAPGSLLIPFAAADAWSKRRDAASQGGIFFLSMVAGPLLLLTISRSKGPLYLLPAFPALALLVGCWCAGSLVRADRSVETGSRIAAGAAWIFATVTIGAMLFYRSPWMPILLILLGAMGLGREVLLILRRGDFANAAVGTAALITLGWIPLFWGPIEAREIAKKTLRPPLEQVFRIVDSRELLLYRSNDPLRGGAGFYRNRTALEQRSAGLLLSRLLEKPPAVLLLRMRAGDSLPPEILREAARRGARLREEARIQSPETNVLVLVSTLPRAGQSSNPLR